MARDVLKSHDPSILSSKHNNKIILILIVAIIFVLVIDTSIIRVSIFANETAYDSKIIIFIVISIIYAVGQYLILLDVKHKSEEVRIKGRLHLRLIHRAVTIVQYLLI